MDQKKAPKPTPRRRPSVKDRQGRPSSPRQAPHRAEAKPSATGIDASAAIQGLAFRPIVIAAAAAIVVLIALVAIGLATCGEGQEAAQAPEAPAANPYKHEGPFSLTFASTGDLMFAREVGTFVDAHGGAAALANVADELSAPDVTIANVEAPLTNDESDALIGKDVYWMSRPAGIDALKAAGIDVVSLANNHIMDYGAAGLRDTLEALDGAGILHAGAGLTESTASEPAELEVNGVRIAFFSWTDIIPDNFLAYGEGAGVVSARMNMADACKRVSEAKETHDIVIVAMHWGVEYQAYIDEAQQQVPAHQLVDAGADVIVGNHPHVIEGIEFYNGALISYSQGDFVCDHYSQETGESFILNFTLTQDGVRDVSATPVYLDDEHGIPSIVTGDHAHSILTRLEEISSGMNSSFTVENDVAYIKPAA